MKNKNESLKNRIVSEQQCMKRITNNDLVCKTCIHKYNDEVKMGNTSICEKYKVKPSNVLLGGECDEYEN